MQLDSPLGGATMSSLSDTGCCWGAAGGPVGGPNVPGVTERLADTSCASLSRSEFRGCRGDNCYLEGMLPHVRAGYRAHDVSCDRKHWTEITFQHCLFHEYF